MKFSKKKVAIVLAAIVLVGVVGFVQTSRHTDLEVNEEDYIPIEERGYENPDALISPFELKEIKDQDDVAVVDFRQGVNYMTGHIPGAIQVWRSDVTDPDHEYAGMRISHEGLVEWLGDNGISNDDTVVVYTSGGGHDAARMWWMMTMMGHEDVRFLDGGLDYWNAIGYDLAMSSPSREPVEYELDESKIDESMLADVDDVLAIVEGENEDGIILDTRSKSEYTGEDEVSGAARAGRIPTPYFIEWTESNNEDNLTKTADELREVFESEGVYEDKNVINYCQSGVRSAHTTLVLSELLGYEDTQNYDGSWIEWSHRDDLDIEKD